MGIFKKGLCVGGLLGAGLVWLITTKKGKELRENMLDQAADIYALIKEKVMSSDQYKKMTKNQYVKLVKEYVDKYAIDNGLAENVKNMVTKVVIAQWARLKKELSK